MTGAGAAAVLSRLRERGWRLALAESLTCGRLADEVGAWPGASAVFWGGFVCYDAGAKSLMLGVRSDLLATFGAVSRETVLAMAEGLLERTPADLVVATTGLAGPEGDGSATPIGRVWLAGAIRGRPVRTVAGNFSGGRAEVRAQAAEAAWRLAAEILDTV